MRRRALCAASSGNPIYSNYLTIEALEDGLTASLSTNACQYCVDGNGEWSSLSAGASTPAIDAGHYVSFKANLTPTLSGIGTFTISKKCNLIGNCNSLLFGDSAADNSSLSGKDRVFYRLFRGNSNIITVSSNFLPATTLATYCYNEMFRDCTSLTTAPTLPATTLATFCYISMFYGCTSLTTAPTLPATILVTNCYSSMFYNCRNLNYIKALLATSPGTSYTKNWVYGVASKGTFVKNKNVSWNVTGANGVPSGWTVIKE